MRGDTKYIRETHRGIQFLRNDTNRNFKVLDDNYGAISKNVLETQEHLALIGDEIVKTNKMLTKAINKLIQE